MKKLNQIEISAEEAAALQAAQTVVENIWQRFRDANGGEYGERLHLQMEVAENANRKPRCWWNVRPWSEFQKTGHAMTLGDALAEMHGWTDPEVKRKHAQKYRDEAEKLEREAKELEKLK